MEFIVKTITYLLDQLRAEGAELPVRLVVLSRNGSLLFVNYDEDEDGELQAQVNAEHQEDGMFGLPVHLFFIDGRGESFRHAVINKMDETPEFVH